MALRVDNPVTIVLKAISAFESATGKRPEVIEVEVCVYDALIKELEESGRYGFVLRNDNVHVIWPKIAGVTVKPLKGK